MRIPITNWFDGYSARDKKVIERRISAVLRETKKFSATGLTRAERTEAAYQRLVQRTRDRYAADPSYKVYARCRSMLNKCMRLARPGMRMEVTFGCNQQELLLHIQKQFLRGMHWNNYGDDGWEVDHIIPRTAFDLSDPAQVLQCNHYSNLRPMWLSDNRSKSDRYGNEERALVAANR